MTYFNQHCKGIALGAMILKVPPSCPWGDLPTVLLVRGRGVTSQESGSLPLCHASVMSTPVTLTGRHYQGGLSALRIQVTTKSHCFIAGDKLFLGSVHPPHVLSTPQGNRECQIPEVIFSGSQVLLVASWGAGPHLGFGQRRWFWSPCWRNVDDVVGV